MDWMNWNIGLAVAIGILTVVVAGLAGQLASTRPWHKWIFWGAGLFIVVLIYCQAVSNEKQARANASEQHNLRVQLDTIQENTERPPKVEVNIPPAPKGRAIMALARDKADDGIKIFLDPQHPELGWAVNVSCRNVGTLIAKRVVCAEFTKRIPAKGGLPTKQTLEEYWADFSKKIVEVHLPQPVDLEPGRNAWGSVSLQMLDVDPELNSGGKVVMVAGVIIYSDDAGRHKKEFCEWAQPPFNPSNTTWHFCEIGHNGEIY